MDQRINGTLRERSRRPVRNKRYSRKNFGEEKKPQKRLFTPEIKRFLKDWLVRRRDNPYPNRDEKKLLAIETGLTYIQVCNWFANWRRKLKNAGHEPQKKTWGHLIKSYNNQVRGNVEHFSICSDDSIWQEAESFESQEEQINFKGVEEGCENDDATVENTNYYKNNCCAVGDKNQNFPVHSSRQCNKNIVNGCITSTDREREEANPFSQHSSKYKNHIMEKYLRDCQKPYFVEPEDVDKCNENELDNKPSMISKWIESAQNFQPSEYSYVQWTFPKSQKRKSKKQERDDTEIYQHHGREELDAAEALTKLALANAHCFTN
ncbi:homeobox protein Mohawk [Agrilus planipennis]|uniref:Homeobox protein Mohawk n=1 Tax=Agrilus planipennis TaxID=224129 RepID=A0A1W4WJV4_AGRPL|nr:homeobox protein Mohawk [Agrilus planipennis]